MEGDSMNNSRSTSDVVGEFIRYQQTGHDFASAWAGIEPIVTGFAVYQLRKMGITRPCRGKGRARHEAGRSAFAVDDAALKDVVHDTVVVLMALAGADAKGTFDGSKAAPGISGLRGWLWRVVESQAVNWVRDHRGRPGLSVKSESCLSRRHFGDRGEPRGFFDQLEAKPERPDLLPILEACIVLLPDAFHGQIALHKLHDERSIRQTARAMLVSPSKVQRQLVHALAALKNLVERHGIDETHLDA
jgi:DNA-directed RNA polymerase specialized sigma24 family protein